MAKKDARRKQWIVTTSTDRPVRDVAKDLTAAGFAVADVYPEIQSISGTANDEAMARVRKVGGVIDVSPDQPVDIGLPDSPETW